MQDFYIPASPEHIKKEKAKARELRKTQWWKRRLNEGVCYYCGQSFSPSELTMDHKMPVGRGGMTSKANVVVACKPCNTRKKHLTPIEMTLESEDL